MSMNEFRMTVFKIRSLVLKLLSVNDKPDANNALYQPKLPSYFDMIHDTGYNKGS